MGFINLAEKTINAKLVYYGVGLGGKTTSLKVVHNLLCPKDEVKLVSINTEQDATLLFDFLPIDIGTVDGFKIRIQGFTVPGQPKYVVMRRYVLSGADAVVLVVDSQKDRVEDNLRAIEDLKENLDLNGLDWERIPLVIQFNKLDLPGTLSVEEMIEKYRFRDVPTFPTIATEQKGVLEAFAQASASLVEDKVRQYGLGKKEGEAPEGIALKARDRILAFSPPETMEEEGVDGAPGAGVLLDLQVSDQENPLEAAGSKGPIVDSEAKDLSVEEELPRGEDEAIKVDEVQEVQEVEGAPKVEESEDLPGDELLKSATEAGSSSETKIFSEGILDDEEHALLGQAVQSNLELAELYSDLSEYKALVERKNRELVEVNQLISHDLKKPLTVFKTVISLLLGGHLGEMHPTQVEALKNASESVAYMQELIDDIVESSRLDYDGMHFDFEEVHLMVLTGTILRRLRFLIEDQGIQVRIEALPVIKADMKALMKIFMNLIGNSASYMDPNKERGLLRIYGKELKDRIEIRVEDNGIGIPEDSQEKIWEKFSRGSNTSGTSGTGLGLYIVRQLVLGHGGDVHVESEVGQGTTFVLSFPKEPVPIAHSPIA
jgi:signal transduction histidine kinase/signal recognition particle receptor subunit beta